MFCPKCGTQLLDEALFCSSCGASLQSSGGPRANAAADTQEDQLSKPLPLTRIFALLAALCCAAAVGVLASCGMRHIQEIPQAFMMLSSTSTALWTAVFVGIVCVPAAFLAPAFVNALASVANGQQHLRRSTGHLLLWSILGTVVSIALLAALVGAPSLLVEDAHVATTFLSTCFLQAAILAAVLAVVGAVFGILCRRALPSAD